MIKYCLTASALKLFSSTPATRTFYRRLGNAVGAKKRASGTLPEYYVRGVERMVRLANERGVFKDGYRILEVGTGWMHWEAVTMALFFDIRAVLFDVWDNRQLIALKNYIAQFGKIIAGWKTLPPERIERAQRIVKQICEANSFDEIYKLLGFEYMVEESGSLHRLADSSFDVVVSARVLEHIGRDTASQFAQACQRVLKSGGHSVQSICIGDHLYAYDRSTSPKQYLAYSDRTWKRWFENRVQYINRIQRSEWIRLFEQTGMKLVHCEDGSVDITNLKIADQYKDLSRADLECHTLTIVHQKTPTGQGVDTEQVHRN